MSKLDPTIITPDLRSIWLREHSLFIRILRGLASGSGAEHTSGGTSLCGCLAEGLKAAEDAERALLLSGDEGGRA